MSEDLIVIKEGITFEKKKKKVKPIVLVDHRTSQIWLKDKLGVGLIYFVDSLSFGDDGGQSPHLVDVRSGKDQILPS